MRDWFSGDFYDGFNRAIERLNNISKFAKYWASEEMAKEIMKNSNYAFCEEIYTATYIANHLYNMTKNSYPSYKNEINFLTQLLKKEWFR